MRAKAGSSPSLSRPQAARLDVRKPRRSSRRSPIFGYGPALLPLVLLLGGCDLFSTREFVPKPSGIRAFSDAFAGEDTLSFRVIESLVEPASKAASQPLSRKLLRFARAGDSLQPGNGWTAVSLRITAEPGGSLVDEGILLLRFDAEGLILSAPDSAAATGADGARYYPFKVSAPAQAAGPAGAGTALQEGSFLSLPPVFTLDASWLQALGVLDVAREIEDTDTLRYRGRLEEAWRVEEVVLDGDHPLARGRFWYGTSGLLKGEQTWEFEGRAADGAPTSARRLRRELVRL